MDPIKISLAENTDTINKIEWYLLTWLEQTKNQKIFTINDKKYKQVMGFRRGFCIHGVFREINGESFAFNVSPDDDMDDDEIVPTFGVHKSFSDLLKHVSIKYDELWNKK